MSITSRLSRPALRGQRLSLLDLKRAVDELEQGLSPAFDLPDLLRACGDLKALAEARRLHRHLDRNGCGRVLILGSRLVQIYVRCGSLEEARATFDGVLAKDVVLWTTMISAYAQHCRQDQAFLLFRQMQLEGVAPDSVAFNAMINACSGSSDFAAEGEALHGRVVELGLVRDQFVATALVNMYGKLGKLEAARTIFRELRNLEAVPWNALLAAYSQHRHCSEANKLFSEMLLEGVRPTRGTYCTVLSLCSGVLEGQRVHGLVTESGLEEDIVAATAVMNMYGKCGWPEEAYRMFSRMPERNTVTWNAVMVVLSDYELFGQAIRTFRQMLLEGFKPTGATFLAVSSACTDLELAVMVQQLAQETGFMSSIVVATELVEMFSRLGCLQQAEAVFEKLEHRDDVLWNSIIKARVQAGQEREAVRDFYQMQREGVVPDPISFVTVLAACATPQALADGRTIHAGIRKAGFEADVIVGTALVNMYGKGGSPDEAEAVFERMAQRSLVTWNAMLAVQSQREDKDGSGQTMVLFRKMQQEGVGLPDKFTMVSLLTAFAAIGDLATVKRVHEDILHRGIQIDALLENALLNAYSMSGGLDGARPAFYSMRNKDSGSWNTIISACAHHGHSREALKLFYQMQQSGARPSSVTFVGVLTGCSHAGLTREGVDCFRTMIAEHGIRPSLEHCGCAVDLLGRVGQLERAEKLIDSLPKEEGVNHSVLWTSLLAACKLHGDLDRAQRAAKYAMDMEENAGSYVALSNCSIDEKHTLTDSLTGVC